MALTFVQAPAKAQVSDATSVSASFASLPSAGSLIVVGFYGVAGGNPTYAATCADNQSNTYTEIDQATSGAGGTRIGAAMFYAKNIGSPSGTFTVTISSLPSGAHTMWIAEVSGADTTAPLDKHSILGNPTNASTQNPTTSATGALAQAAEIVFGQTGTYPTFQSGGTTSIDNAGYTQIIDTGTGENTNTYGWGEADYKIVAATTTQTLTWTTDYGANDCLASVATFKEAAGGGGDPEGRLKGGKLIRGGLLRGGVLAA